MINAKVLKRFKDRKTGKVHDSNETIKVSEKRFKEINSTIHGVLIERIEGEKKSAKGN